MDRAAWDTCTECGCTSPSCGRIENGPMRATSNAKRICRIPTETALVVFPWLSGRSKARLAGAHGRVAVVGELDRVVRRAADDTRRKAHTARAERHGRQMVLDAGRKRVRRRTRADGERRDERRVRDEPEVALNLCDRQCGVQVQVIDPTAAAAVGESMVTVRTYAAAGQGSADGRCSGPRRPREAAAYGMAQRSSV